MMKSPTSPIRIMYAVGVMLAMSTILAVVLSAGNLSQDRALGQAPAATPTPCPGGSISIDGKLEVGQELEANLGGMTDNTGGLLQPNTPGSCATDEQGNRLTLIKGAYGRAWYRDDVAIPGAGVEVTGKDENGSLMTNEGPLDDIAADKYYKYTLQQDDVGKMITLKVTLLQFDPYASDIVYESDPVGPVRPLPTPTPAFTGEITKIEPSIRGVTVSGGDVLTLSVNVYGLQGVMDNKLSGTFSWNADGGDIADASGREISYTAPSSPGTYTVKASLGRGDCDHDASGGSCMAEFEVQVRRPAPSGMMDEKPVNPPGDIPSIIADADGNQYDVFTPEDGGTFDSGEGYSIHAAAGAVPNGEFVGVRMSDDGAASNTGMTHHRYTLGGNAYGVHAVDGSGAAVSSYALNGAADVCVPLPDELRSNISDVALVVINSDDSLTILSGSVRIASGTMVCGSLSGLPAQVAVGSAGAPAAIPTHTPEPTPEPPVTGGTAPSSSGSIVWMLLLGIAVAALGSTLLIARRRHATATRQE